jgi:hypothetical protein|tara:strand:+ start:405 stop:728 length:324 start_codon:yes stop_codon:yes gene_type:complete
MYSNGLTLQLSDIIQIQAKKGTGSQCGKGCAGSCVGFFLYSYLIDNWQYEKETYNYNTGQYETETVQVITVPELVVWTIFYSAVSYGAGWLVGTLTDSWQVVYFKSK